MKREGMSIIHKKNKCFYIVRTCETGDVVGVYSSLKTLHRKLRLYNRTCDFPFLRFKDMQIFTGEDDMNPVYDVVCIRNEQYWQ